MSNPYWLITCAVAVSSAGCSHDGVDPPRRAAIVEVDGHYDESRARFFEFAFEHGSPSPVDVCEVRIGGQDSGPTVELPPLIDVGPTVELVGPANETLVLSRDGTGGYRSVGYPAGSEPYDLVISGGPGLRAQVIESVVRPAHDMSLADDLTITAGSAYTVAWSGASETGSAAITFLPRGNSSISCRGQDDGEFTVPGEFTAFLGTAGSGLVVLHAGSRESVITDSLDLLIKTYGGDLTSYTSD